MIVAGGTYIERCITPSVQSLFGSGGRAALAIRNLDEVQLHTFYPDVRDIRANFGANAVVHPTDAAVTFEYLHPLARPHVSPFPLPRAEAASVSGSRVIRFGCLESSFVVDAGCAVYDPQGDPALFLSNGSRADHLAIVLNAGEAQQLTGTDDVAEALRRILRGQKADAVVVKHGPDGALVGHGDGSTITHVPAFRTESLFKIGSGDVFSATFAHYWATEGDEPAKAAHKASLQVAGYVATRVLPCPAELPRYPVAAMLGAPPTVAIVADGGTIATQWMIEEATAALRHLGAATVTVPHGNNQNVPLKNVDVLFAAPSTVDGWAMEAIRAAGRLKIPCIAFIEEAAVRWQSERWGATVVEDFSASLYAAMWARP
jgi:hypothetical protein